MAERPEDGEGNPDYIEWASQTLTQVIVKNNEVLVLDNKTPPIPEFTSFGLRPGQPPTFQEVNYQFDGASKWIQHLDQRYSVGSIHKTTSAEDSTAIGIRLGGTWENLGTESVGGETIQVWRKTG